jgi:transposase
MKSITLKTSDDYVVADAKLYSEANTANLKKLGFITRVPGTLKLVTHVIAQALGGGYLAEPR